MTRKASPKSNYRRVKKPDAKAEPSDPLAMAKKILGGCLLPWHFDRRDPVDPTPKIRSLIRAPANRDVAGWKPTCNKFGHAGNMATQSPMGQGRAA